MEISLVGAGYWGSKLLHELKTIDAVSDVEIIDIKAGKTIKDINYEFTELKNIPEIKWHNKVHEVIKGHKKFVTLPTNPEYSLWHPKHITRQEIQNKNCGQG